LLAGDDYDDIVSNEELCISFIKKELLFAQEVSAHRANMLSIFAVINETRYATAGYTNEDKTAPKDTSTSSHLKFYSRCRCLLALWAVVNSRN
jgi:hypothetical protein